MKATDIVVWLADSKNADSETIYKLYGHLFEEKRRNAIKRIKNEGERKNRICTGFLLLKVLEEYDLCPDDIRYFENGKPYIFGRDDLFFNLSHSKGRIMLALSGQEIGCDIQKYVEYRESLVKRICSETEISKPGVDVREKLNSVWAIKESYTKLTGTGISVDLKDISFDISNDNITVYEHDLPAAFGKTVIDEEDYYGIVVGKNPFENALISYFSF